MDGTDKSKFKKNRRVKSQQAVEVSQPFEKHIMIEVYSPESQCYRINLQNGSTMKELKKKLKNKFGDNAIYYSFEMSCEFDYCLEKEIGKIEKAMKIRFEGKDEHIVEDNNLRAYTIYKCISVGGFSQVFLVRSKRTGQFFAAKFIDKSFNSDKKFRHLIENERTINSALDHPFIVKMHNFIETQNFFVFILDYCPSGELFGLMKKHRNMTEAQARFYFLETVLAIKYMHEKNIMYRDIKPENILLDEKGHIKIADFGLAKVVREKSNSYCGSLEYMAPQIVLGEKYSFSVDFYCLGSLLFEMMIGCPPFYNPDFSAHETKYHIVHTEPQFPQKKKLSNNFKDFVIKLLEKDQSKRLGSKSGFAEVLSHPWVGSFNPSEYENYQIKNPFETILSKNNFETQFLPEKQILRAMKKIEKDLKAQKCQQILKTCFQRKSVKKISSHSLHKNQNSTPARKKSIVCRQKKNSFLRKGEKSCFKEQKNENEQKLLNFSELFRATKNNIGMKKEIEHKNRGKRRTKSNDDLQISKAYCTIYPKEKEKYRRNSKDKESVNLQTSALIQKSVHDFLLTSNKFGPAHRKNSNDYILDEEKNKENQNLKPSLNMKVKKNRGAKGSRENLFKMKMGMRGEIKDARRQSNLGNRISDCFVKNV